MKILIVVDMQHDFIDGALGSPEARSIVDAVIYKIDKRISEGYKVIYTKDTHYTDYLETQEGRHLPVAHCIKDTPGWNIPEKLWREGAVVIEKNGFGSWELAESLAKEKDIESIELIGVCTDICVISNASTNTRSSCLCRCIMLCRSNERKSPQCPQCNETMPD